MPSACNEVFISLIISIRGRIQLFLVDMHQRDDAMYPSSPHTHVPSSCLLSTALSGDRGERAFQRRSWRQYFLTEIFRNTYEGVSIFNWIPIHSYRTKKLGRNRRMTKWCRLDNDSKWDDICRGLNEQMTDCELKPVNHTRKPSITRVLRAGYFPSSHTNSHWNRQ